MNAAEAITRLIEIGQLSVKDREARLEIKEEGCSETIQEDQLAIAVVTAMINTFLPIARYRAFVEVIEMSRKRHAVANVTADFTVCAVSMAAIKSGLSGVSVNDMEIRAMVFEQTATGATVITGFQGFTKSQRYRAWYNSLDALEQLPTVN